MSVPRIIVASDLIEGDQFMHNGIVSTVLSTRQTPRYAFVKVAVGKRGREKNLRFWHTTSITILPKPPKPPAAKPPSDDSGISEIPVSRFLVRDISKMRNAKITAIGEEPAQDGIVLDLEDDMLEVVFVTSGREIVVRMRGDELEVRGQSDSLSVHPHSSNVVRIMPL